jgi:CheY-like chemotaxis protein
LGISIIHGGGGEVAVNISDTGTGITEENQARIFDPFFTTKPAGKGTGLGLAVSYGIIRDHGGEIRVSSIPRKGSTFSIMRPVENDGHGDSGTVAVDRARVLVVDDEPEMCQTCRKILARHGHEVWLAESGAAGLHALRERPIDLAVIDLRLPDMDGLEVLRQAKRINPDIIAIIITAHGTVDSAIEAVREGAFDYLLKPFSMAELEVTTSAASITGAWCRKTASCKANSAA